jgi:hypothetical protein
VSTDVLLFDPPSDELAVRLVFASFCHFMTDCCLRLAAMFARYGAVERYVGNHPPSCLFFCLVTLLILFFVELWLFAAA